MKFFDLEMNGLAGGLSKRNPMKATQYSDPNANGDCQLVQWHGGTGHGSCSLNPYGSTKQCGTTTIYHPKLNK